MIRRKNQRKAKNVLLEGKIGTLYPILCHVWCVLSKKNVHVFRLAIFVINVQRERYNRVYVLSCVRTNRVSLYLAKTPSLPPSRLPCWQYGFSKSSENHERPVSMEMITDSHKLTRARTTPVGVSCLQLRKDSIDPPSSSPSKNMSELECRLSQKSE